MTKVRGLLVGSLLVVGVWACRGAFDTPTQPSQSGEGDDGRATVSTYPIPGPAPVPGGAGPAPVPGGAVPAPVPGAPSGPRRSPTPSPSASPTPLPTPDPSGTPRPPPLVEGITTASGRTYHVCDFEIDGLDACALIYRDDQWSKGRLDPAFILQTFNADAARTESPFVTFRVTRPATVVVYFNYTDSPGGNTFCGATHPAWAADGTGWRDAGLSDDVTLLTDPTQERRFRARERTFPAGATVTLGPNTIPSCPAGFQPLMYFARIVG
jgi:hypothetical protein